MKPYLKFGKEVKMPLTENQNSPQHLDHDRKIHQDLVTKLQSFFSHLLSLELHC